MDGIPSSTYRLQFNANFTFKQATELVAYLHQLGISHCYASPILRAKAGSIHGYDIVDHSCLNPEIGTLEEFETYIKTLRENKMRLILDIIPNHMCISDTSNIWWYDVLENGPASPYAEFFDIDWHSSSQELVNKVLLPILDQQYGDALENQVLKIVYQNGSFFLELNQNYLPTDPSSWILILSILILETEKVLSKEDPHFIELQSIHTALVHLPATTVQEKEKQEERQREKEVIKRRLDSLMNSNSDIYKLLMEQLALLNGKENDPRSFDWLESFVKVQPYRLCFWRVANEKINYRRFFDMIDLAGIRTDDARVFEAVHALLFTFIKKHFVDGVRIDHLDGLWNPTKYLEDLHMFYIQKEDSKGTPETFYVIAEKILLGDEKLRPEWILHGTVGYDFLNQLNGLFVYQPHKKVILENYRNFTNFDSSVRELIYASKKLILDVSLSSELYVLSRRLEGIAEQHRSSRDFSSEGLRAALSDMIAEFSVYRSYITSDAEIGTEDKNYISLAIGRAKRRNPSINETIFTFIENVLLLKHLPELTEEHIAKRKDFIMHFQQLTAPVMGKGLEDTAFYRYFPLASLNEVGSDLINFGISLETFHKKNLERSIQWPYTMLSTSTHDTKRSEDVRARINVLSEIPEEWSQALTRWSQANQQHKVLESDSHFPDTNAECLLYQTLVGTWSFYPMSDEEHGEYVGRIQIYMDKASKEAKVHTSWINPNKSYDQILKQFIEAILSNSSDNLFLTDFQLFQKKIAAAGMLNSIAQLIIKFTSPGVPDLYQGNELWDFSLVDPDNRRPIDFFKRKKALDEIVQKKIEFPDFFVQSLKKPDEGKIKMFFTFQTLKARRDFPDLFSKGSYIQLQVMGDKQNHILSFARQLHEQIVIVITARFFTFLLNDDFSSIPTWGNLFLEVPSELNVQNFCNVYTDECFEVEHQNEKKIINLGKVLQSIPFALLVNQKNKGN